VWRAVAILTALTFAGFVPLAAQSESEPAESPANGPRLKIDARELDFGDVVRGETVEGAFAIENIGDQSLYIEKAQPGCGCTLASFDAVIPPGQTGYVRVALDTTKQPRTTGRYVTVHSNDPVEPRIQLRLKAMVVGSIELKPGDKVQLGNRRNQRMEPSVLVRKDVTETGKLQISELVPSSEWLQVRAEEVLSSREAGEYLPVQEAGDWILHFSLADDAPFVRGRETVRFKTGLPREPERELTLYISYDAPLELSSPQVELTLDGDGNSTKETVFVKIRNGLDGELLVDTDPPELGVSLRDLGKRQYHADIEWNGGDRKVGSVYFHVGEERMRLPVVRQLPAQTASR
jgi:hypothetical protein